MIGIDRNAESALILRVALKPFMIGRNSLSVRCAKLKIRGERRREASEYPHVLRQNLLAVTTLGPKARGVSGSFIPGGLG